MGFEYIIFRTVYEFKRKTGFLKKQFPSDIIQQKFISLKDWKKNSPQFFLNSKENLKFRKNPNSELKEEYNRYLDGELKYFNSKYYKIGRDYNWITNPFTNYKYNIKNHWTEIEDINEIAGDIKYVWEKSRFSFLYMLIRYDYHFEIDNAKLVFDEILSWINANPLNKGPNYKCSQEISLRVLNWTFVLFYYKNSKELSEDTFYIIINSIDWQLKHVYSNINFSRKSVRNNHAITETLMLYLGGLLFPFLPDAKKWKTKGKNWFEEEIEYQIYEDGSHLQFSMNYHRVVIQLLTWSLILSKKNNERFNDIVYSRAEQSLLFLSNHINNKDGWLPNYGANDGALFFKLNNSHYRNYKPQINALQFALEKSISFEDEESKEDICWYGGNEFRKRAIQKLGVHSFPKGGYYTIRDENTFTFIRCGKYKDRPSQADNLHLDIWVDGENILRDAGSYLYNTDIKTIKFFNGTKSHNTVMLGKYDQMLKGPRFIWYYWTQAIDAEIEETNDYFLFTGKIRAFEQVNKNIIHHRSIKKYKEVNKWEVTDSIEYNTNLPLIQIWNPNNFFYENYRIEAKDGEGKSITPSHKKGYYSSFYGVKEETTQVLFETNSNTIKTIIETI